MYINQNYETTTYENVQCVGQIYGPPNRPENQIYGTPNGVRMAGPPQGPQMQRQYEPYRPQNVMRSGVQVQYRPTQMSWGPRMYDPPQMIAQNGQNYYNAHNKDILRTQVHL